MNYVFPTWLMGTNTTPNALWTPGNFLLIFLDRSFHSQRTVLFFFFYCSGFCHTLKWNSHGFTCVPHPDSPSHLPLHPIPLGLPSFSYTCTRRYSAPDSKLSRPPRPSPLQLLPSRTLPCKFCLYLYSLPTPYPQFTGSTGPLWVPLSYTAIWKLIQSSNLEQF